MQQTNLYLFPNSRPDDILDTHKLVSNRLMALELHYSRQSILEYFQDKLDKSQVDTQWGVSYYNLIERHITNLVLTYGISDVRLMILDLYPELKKQKAKAA